MFIAWPSDDIGDNVGVPMIARPRYVDMEMIEHNDVQDVYLDGRRQTHCTAAQEGYPNKLDGWVDRYLTDEHGTVLGPNGQSPTERVHGEVVILWKSDAYPPPDYSQITREIVGR